MTSDQLTQAIAATDSNADEINEIDTDGLSLEELKALALRQSSDAEASEEQATPESAPAPEKERTPEVHRRVIDLGDGAGTEVFEAPTMEALLDKIVEAKANATRKIREQQAKLKELEIAPKAEPDNSEDEFILSQEMMTRPTDAVKKAFKRATGLDIAEIKSVADRVKALDAAQSAQSDMQAQETAANAFISAHPEYVANQNNGARLSRAVNLLVAEAKQSGQQIDYSTLLSKAYDDLSTSGLLQLKSEDVDKQPAKGPTGPATRRIGDAEGTDQTQPVRRSSSLASRAHAMSTPKKELTEDDLYAMPLDKLKELALQAAR